MGKTTKALATQSQFSQKDIPDLLEKVEQRIGEIKKGMPSQPKTKGALAGFGEIKNVNSVEQLVKALSMLKAKEKAYKEAAKELDVDLKKYPFKADGFAVSSWETDIKARVGMVQHKDELNKLNKVKQKLEENLSAKAKLARDLEEMSAILAE